MFSILFWKRGDQFLNIPRPESPMLREKGVREVKMAEEHISTQQDKARILIGTLGQGFALRMEKKRRFGEDTTFGTVHRLTAKILTMVLQPQLDGIASREVQDHSRNFLLELVPEGASARIV
jgi:hypothetical protein